MFQPVALGAWQEVGDRIFVLSAGAYRLNAGLIVGAERALVIDTGAGPRQGQAILSAVREITELPLSVVNTHSHFDHFFGNAVFAAAGAEEIYAHERCAADIRSNGELQRALVQECEPEMAARDGEHTDVVPPTRLVPDGGGSVELGGRRVELFHLGRGHTDNDLLVAADSVLFTGDLLEEGAAPAFEDAYPSDWLQALERLIRRHGRHSTFVPGHGSPVDLDFVRVQAGTLSRAIRIGKQARREAPSDATKTIPILPYGPEQSRALLQRLRAVG